MNPVGNRGAQPRFGRMTSGSTSVVDGLDRAVPPSSCSASSMRMATGAVSSKPTPCWRADYIFHAHPARHRRPGQDGSAPSTEILRHQNDDGGWSTSYPGGPSNINAMASKPTSPSSSWAGSPADHPVMVRARENWMLAHGGVRGMQHLHQDLSLLALASTTTTPSPPSRPRSSSSPTGSTSTSTRSAPGRAAILVPLSIMLTPRSRSKSLHARAWASMSCLLVAATSADLRLRWDRKKIVGWRNFFLICRPVRSIGFRTRPYPPIAQV